MATSDLYHVTIVVGMPRVPAGHTLILLLLLLGFGSFEGKYNTFDGSIIVVYR